MRVIEATATVAEGALWYAVLASLPGNGLDVARRVADEKKQMAVHAGFAQPVQIYKTKISDNYAVVLGGQMRRSDALSLATLARQKNLAVDAFAQQDRSWTLVEDVTAR